MKDRRHHNALCPDTVNHVKYRDGTLVLGREREKSGNQRYIGFDTARIKKRYGKKKITPSEYLFFTISFFFVSRFFLVFPEDQNTSGHGYIVNVNPGKSDVSHP